MSKYDVLQIVCRVRDSCDLVSPLILLKKNLKLLIDFVLYF